MTKSNDKVLQLHSRSSAGSKQYIWTQLVARNMEADTNTQLDHTYLTGTYMDSLSAYFPLG